MLLVFKASVLNKKQLQGTTIQRWKWKILEKNNPMKGFLFRCGILTHLSSTIKNQQKLNIDIKTISLYRRFQLENLFCLICFLQYIPQQKTLHLENLFFEFQYYVLHFLFQ